MRFKKISILFMFAVLVTGVLKAGDKTIPDFYANNQAGALWQLYENLDKLYLVVYFYPAAMTGGCTAQACAYRDDLSVLEKMGVNVVGVSGDPVKNLKWFAATHNLNFALLSDVNGEIARLFDIPLRDGGTIEREIDGDSKTLARSYTSARWTFILDNEGNVIYTNQDVKAADDSQHVIKFLKSL